MNRRGLLQTLALALSGLLWPFRRTAAAPTPTPLSESCYTEECLPRPLAVREAFFAAGNPRELRDAYAAAHPPAAGHDRVITEAVVIAGGVVVKFIDLGAPLPCKSYQAGG